MATIKLPSPGPGLGPDPSPDPGPGPSPGLTPDSGFKIPKMPIVHKKYIPEAFARIMNAAQAPPGPFIFVWLMNEDGTQVENLAIENFDAGYFKNDFNGFWVKIPIFDFMEIDTGSPFGHHRLYRLGLQPNNFSDLFENMVFSIEVFSDKVIDGTKMAYRGQCLAYLQPKNVKITSV